MLFNQQNLRDTLFFTITYVPSAFKRIFTYCIVGGLIGCGSGYVFRSSLKEYARMQHNAIDLTQHYVPDNEQFLHFSRGVNNTITPPISDFLPVYSALLGAGAGLFFSITELHCGYHKGLEKEESSEDEKAGLTV